MLSSGVKQSVRYWGFLVGKFAAAGVIAVGCEFALNRFWPVCAFYCNYLAYMVAQLGLFMGAAAMFYLSLLDQRYRCRVCLRRLRMPVGSGSWSNMLQFGRPRMAYICTYGHGTLNISELHITGIENPEWTEHADYWEELCSSGKDDSSNR